jgi:hypothetical protein
MSTVLDTLLHWRKHGIQGAIPVTTDPSGNVVGPGLTTLLDAVTATGAGSSVSYGPGPSTFQATLSNTTTPAATVDVEVSNNGTQWVTLGAITLSGALATDGFAADAPWKYVRGNVTAISGASATVTLLMGA